ncbi:hypothetical protein CC85DRAFT_282854 [Cutaneotrichosporon oleaginosum]|uniref:Prefoldin n=1 Tax=Cutaneotrichosporon oleaginosum TaxID=879819 RepID=A0A0J0XWB1_9TREE|nr:uncharacterized protein CC85DRAFT_282854 [Cutaneotrichosporon oleaginosum]KLT45366.1 hypothetical protein CC85DRAFT_282854 [Cutaneotrichosporon oleaginosum]TXT14810.1 hypothetical protein COLE_01003 [Cutaneotrichosporon oleaginosum]
MSSAAYSAQIQNTLVPALAAVREEIARVDGDIRDYEQVARRLERLDGKPHAGPSELGAGVWVDTVVPSTAAITLDLGLDVHLALPPKEAAEYATRRAGVLKKKREVLVRREERLLWEVEQFEGAVREAQAREAQSA